jgi:hypothetical protein
MIRAIPYRKGKGSGEQFVREHYVNQLKAFRQRQAKTILIVAIDADLASVEQRNAQLDQECQQNGVDPRSKKEAIVHFIPKRHIETWLAYLDGKVVNEEDSYKTEYGFQGRESEAKRLIDQLCSASSDKPSSLVVACEEWRTRGAGMLR